MEKILARLRIHIRLWLKYFLSLLLSIAQDNKNKIFKRISPRAPNQAIIRNPTKPEWVKQEVIRLKALMPYDGCRKIAYSFNRLYQQKRKMTISKTYVYNKIKQHHYEIQVLSKKIKHRRPKPLPKNLIWSMDLTQVPDSKNQSHTLFGIIDSGTRACLSLQPVPNKASLTLLRIVLDVIESYGFPKSIRTDNEAVFTSRLFRLSLFLLGINHQRTEKCCPWMNGKIERFFGTLKNKLQYHLIENASTLTKDIALFRCWYNHVRTHQHLEGRTPAETWNKQQAKHKGKAYYFCEWEGALTGFYLPSG